MISYIFVAALLGIIATIWTIVISKDKSAVKSIIKWIAYTVIINGIILMGLRLIGLHGMVSDLKRNIFALELSLRFSCRMQY